MNINIALIVAGVIVLAFTAAGYAKGLIKMVYKLFSGFVVMLIAWFTRGWFADILKSIPQVYSAVYKKIETVIALPIASKEEMVAWLSEKFSGTVQGLVVGLAEGLLDSAQDSYNSFREAVYSKLADIVLDAGGFIVAFIVMLLIVKLGFIGLEAIGKLPVINTVNRCAGAILGSCAGILVVWMLCGIVSITSQTGYIDTIAAEVYDSEVLTFLCEHNIVNTIAEGELDELANKIEDEISTFVPAGAPQ